MKKILSVVLSIIMFVICFAFPVNAEEEPDALYDDAGYFYCGYTGDVDGDGKVTTTDARLVLRKASKLAELDARYLLAADADGNGKTAVADARLILRVAAKLDSRHSLAYLNDDGTYIKVVTGNLPFVTPYKSDSYIYTSSGECKNKYLVGAKFVLRVNDTIINSGLTWKSINPKVAVVDSNGTVTTLAEGFTCFIATYNNVDYYYDIVVQSELQKKIDELRNVYPQGYYWNNYPKSKDYPMVTETPCADHLEGKYSMCCGQCAGFAAMLSNTVFGKNAPYKYYKNDTEIKVGDYIRYNSRHSIFVISVVKKGNIQAYSRSRYGSEVYEDIYKATEDYITVAHCNYYYKCDIRWDDVFYPDNLTLNRNYCYSRY